VLEKLRERARRLKAELDAVNERLTAINVPDRLTPEVIASMSAGEFRRLKRLMDERKRLFERAMDIAVRLNRIEEEIRKRGG
jgi:predicted nuclease with TOPRIM domain